MGFFIDLIMSCLNIIPYSTIIPIYGKISALDCKLFIFRKNDDSNIGYE